MKILKSLGFERYTCLRIPECWSKWISVRKDFKGINLEIIVDFYDTDNSCYSRGCKKLTNGSCNVRIKAGPHGSHDETSELPILRRFTDANKLKTLINILCNEGI